MALDVSGLPIAGGLVVAGFLYAGVSALVTGPMIGERTIERSDWPRQCTILVRTEIDHVAPQSPPIPEIDCEGLTRAFGEMAGALCQLPMIDQALAAPNLERQAREMRRDQAIAGIASRCDCAAQVTLSEEWLAFATYAGSARMVTPPVVKSLDTRLVRALHGPLCASDQGGAR